MPNDIDDFLNQPVQTPPGVITGNTGFFTVNTWTTQGVNQQQTTAEQVAAFINTLESKRGRKVAAEPPKSNSVILQDLYNYPRMAMDKTRISAYEKKEDFQHINYPWCTTDGHVGIEIEVENIRHGVQVEAYWQAKADGSLRNNGIELVSAPLQIKHVANALDHAMKCLKKENTPDFSNRTSIHIHLNCRDMTHDQVWNLVILYALFERHFYKVAGTKRLNSIFCVPLHRTNLLKNIEMIYGNHNNWHKYAGLNILPLFDHDGQRGYGTIEFRHLYGTDNIEEICAWINDILALRKAARSMTKEDLMKQIKEMNTTSSYFSLYHDVFRDARRILTDKKDFESCISNIKRELLGDVYFKQIANSLSERGIYWLLSKKLSLRNI